MRVLIACERNGVIRDAFIKAGHDAWSCDLVDTLTPGPHIKGDALAVLCAGWDLMIAHPDCTYLTCSAEWAYGDGPYHQKVKPGTLVGAARRAAREDALRFVEAMAAAPIPRIAIENPAIGAINRNVDLVKYGFRSSFPHTGHPAASVRPRCEQGYRLGAQRVTGFGSDGSGIAAHGIATERTHSAPLGKSDGQWTKQAQPGRRSRHGACENLSRLGGCHGGSVG